jgi:hypothetical protein
MTNAALSAEFDTRFKPSPMWDNGPAIGTNTINRSICARFARKTASAAQFGSSCDAIEAEILLTILVDHNTTFLAERTRHFKMIYSDKSLKNESIYDFIEETDPNKIKRLS